MRHHELGEPPSVSRQMSRHPFQLWILAAFVAGGVGVLLGPDPASLDALVPTWARTTWAITLVLGGLLGLVAASWRDPATALLLERAALLPIGGAALAYGVAVFFIAGPPGLVASLLTVTVGIASGARCWQVSQQLRRLELLAPARGPQ